MRNILRSLGIFLGLALPAQDAGMHEPTRHHKALAAQVGTWVAVARMYVSSTKPPLVSHGTEVNTLVAGGLWLRTELKATLMGSPFEGHGLFGYDTLAKAHVGSWVDSSGTWMAVTRGSCERDCQVQTAFFDGYDEAGRPALHKEVHTQVDANHRTMVMFLRVQDGTWVKSMEMTYTRLK